MTSSPTRQTPLPASALRVEVTEIMDQNGFSHPMVAARALTPAGWRAEGGVRWNQGNPECAEPATFAWSSISPDGLSRVELFPTELWMASNSGSVQCQFAVFEDARSFLTAYLQRRYPGAQPLDYRPRIDFLDAQKEYLQAKIAMINNSGMGMRAWADAGEMTYSHREKGVEIKGIVSASAMFYSTTLSNPLGGAPMRMLSAQTTGTFAARAPKEQFDAKMMEAIRKSVKPDVAWASEYFKFQQRLGGIQAQGASDRAAIIVAGGAAMTAATIAANNAAVAKGYADLAGKHNSPPPGRTAPSASADASDERRQRESIEAIRGVETYYDPLAEGTVQLDATYDNAWRVQNSDSYILTNDPNFNPGLYDIQAQKLQVVK